MIQDKKIEYIRRLGIGGMGEVWLANLKSTRDFQKLVAIKRIRPGANSLGLPADERLLREAKLMSGLSHSNIVTVFDVLEEDGEILIVMEYLEGRTLKDLISIEGRFGAEQLLNILGQILSGIVYAHQNKVAHLDLSPHNIFLTDNGLVKILDFGISRNIDDKSEQTISKDISGKLAYLPPEVFSRGNFTTASDVWSIGVIAWELITGIRFITSENEFSRIKELSTLTQVLVQEKICRTPVRYHLFLKASLQTSPSDRASASELLKLLKGSVSNNRSVRLPSYLNRKLVVVLVFLLIISASITAFVHLHGYNRSEVMSLEPAVFFLSKPENHLARFREVPETITIQAPFSDRACDSFCSTAFDSAINDFDKKYISENLPKMTSYFHVMRYQTLNVALDQALIRPCLSRPRCQVLSHSYSSLREFMKKFSSMGSKDYSTGKEYWGALEASKVTSILSDLKEAWENTLRNERAIDHSSFLRFNELTRHLSSMNLVSFPEWSLYLTGAKLFDAENIGRLCIDIAASQVLLQVHSRFRRGIFPVVPKKTFAIVVLSENPLFSLFNESPTFINLNTGNKLDVPMCKVEFTNSLSRLRQYP